MYTNIRGFVNDSMVYDFGIEFWYFYRLNYALHLTGTKKSF